MSNKSDDFILSCMLPGESYKTQEIADVAEVCKATVWAAMSRLAARGLVSANRSRRWVEYRINEAPPVPAQKINLLNRAAYAQTGTLWDLRRKQIAEFREIKSRHA